MTKWNLKNASEKEKEIYRQEVEKVYQKELQRRTPLYQHQKVYRSIHLKQLRRNRTGPP